MQSSEKKRRWGPEQRLEFIEFMLFWGGGLNRSDLTDRFGVSVPQASNDLTAYKELAPGNLDYDSSGKKYIPSATFQPRFLKPNPDRYLAQLKALSDGIIELAETWLPGTAETGVLPIPNRRIDARVLRALLSAVRENRAIEIEYQSTSPENPDPLSSKISILTILIWVVKLGPLRTVRCWTLAVKRLG